MYSGKIAVPPGGGGIGIKYKNAASIRGTFPDSPLISEIFVLQNKNVMYLS
jgi:hypothetical protein